MAACAVLGVADERLGERVVALVEAAPDATVDEDARPGRTAWPTWPSTRCPERFVVVDALPRNAMGKIVRRQLGPLLPDR